MFRKNTVEAALGIKKKDEDGLTADFQRIVDSFSNTKGSDFVRRLCSLELSVRLGYRPLFIVKFQYIEVYRFRNKGTVRYRSEGSV